MDSVSYKPSVTSSRSSPSTLSSSLSLNILVSILCLQNASSFSTHPIHAKIRATAFGGISTPSSQLHATRTKKKTGKKGTGGGMGGGGMGTATKKKMTSPPFDVSSALLRSEKLYEKIMQVVPESDEPSPEPELVTSEYVIAARYSPLVRPVNGAASLCDWTPVAQLCLARGEGAEDDGRGLVPRGISAYCREIHHAAVIAAPVFASLPRTSIEYSFEPVDAFHKFVFGEVIEGGAAAKKGSSEEGMGKVRAREVLGLDAECEDMGEMKRAYRKLSFQLHPDRFAGEERTDEEKEGSDEAYSLVKVAYEILSSGVRNGGGGQGRSWYESLGGRSRIDFVGPVDLVAVNEAKMGMDKTIREGGFQSAVCGLDPELVMGFVARNQASAVVSLV